MKTAQHYIARWAQPGQPSIGNVSFVARSDTEAKRKADKIAHQIGLPSTPRTLTRGYTTIETLNRGLTWPDNR